MEAQCLIAQVVLKRPLTKFFKEMIQIFSWIWVFSGILLILLVLLHSPKGDGMGGIAASGSSMFNSASSAESSLNKITWTFLSIFLSLAIILSAGWIS